MMNKFNSLKLQRLQDNVNASRDRVEEATAALKGAQAALDQAKACHEDNWKALESYGKDTRFYK